ncbi:hypothetical protein ABZS54_32790, partial [Embleya sp. NPDC005575]
MVTVKLEALTSWAQAHPWFAAAVTVPSVLLSLYGIIRGIRALGRSIFAKGGRSDAVVVASIGAVLSTGLSGDTAWRFAEHRLGISNPWERGLIFLVGEVALFALALMARANLRTQGRAGAPGVLVWVAAAVLAVPAVAESNSLAAAIVRVMLGPVLGALLWHMAMGIELRHTDSDMTDTGILAIITREVRERTLARLGLSVRDRTAEQISRDRATVKATVLAARYASYEPTAVRRRSRTLAQLQRELRRAGVAQSPAQRTRLLRELAHSNNAAGLATLELPSPWAIASAEVGTTDTNTEAVRAEVADLDAMVGRIQEADRLASRALLDMGTTEPGTTRTGDHLDAGTTEPGTTRTGDHLDAGTTEPGTTRTGDHLDAGTTEPGTTRTGDHLDAGTTEPGTTRTGDHLDAGTT